MISLFAIPLSYAKICLSKKSCKDLSLDGRVWSAIFRQSCATFKRVKCLFMHVFFHVAVKSYCPVT